MVAVTLANYEYPPACGGGGQFTADLARSLRDRDHDVAVVADTRDAPTASLAQLATYPLRSLPGALTAAREADVINGHFALPTSAALPAVQLATGTPLVVNLMGADVYDPTRYQRVRPLLDGLLRHWVGAAADALVVPSTDMAARVPDALRPKTHVIPYFVDQTRFRRGVVDTTPPLDLLTVCRLVKRKRLDRALKAVRVCRDRGQDVRLTIAGEGPEREALEEQVERHCLAEAVEFLGYVPDARLPAVYRNHDAFLLPSAHEAFGIAIVEALASGLPAVVSDTGGQTDIVTDAVGRCVDPTPKRLADAIGDVWDDLGSMHQAARERVLQHYTPNAVVERYERLYREVAR